MLDLKNYEILERIGRLARASKNAKEANLRLNFKSLLLDKALLTIKIISNLKIHNILYV